MMLSESQERMLMVLKPGREDEARRIFEKWELDFAIIGKLTATGHMILKHKGEIVGDLPIDPLAQASPEYDRPWTPTAKRATLVPADVPAPNDVVGALALLIGSPDLCAKRWIWEQYDHMVMADTAQRPGGDAAVVRVHGTKKALALTSDSTPRYCLADPVEGGRQAVAEAWRNLTAVGARPLAITDNMNFGNPERPEIMGQFAGCIQGMAEACRALDFPVVSGNVSLYNETNGKAIPPTPTIGGVGLLADVARMATLAFKAAGEAIVLVGETRGHLGCSLYLREILKRDVSNRDGGAPPPVDLKAERKNGDFVRERIARRAVTAVHDLSDGGLLVGIAEMALAGGIGAEIAPPDGTPPLHAWLFGEDQGRYLLTAPDSGALLAAAKSAGVAACVVGWTGGDGLTVRGERSISLRELREAHEGWLPRYMAGGA
jgi:phosphoribosylformylglycinamidine synthase